LISGFPHSSEAKVRLCQAASLVEGYVLYNK
jgi:hypothetical protein